MAKKKYRDRIKELVRVKASEVLDSPLNPKLHGDAQKQAMADILGELGWIDGLIAFRDKRGRLRLINGHMRKNIAGDEVVPVVVVDLTEGEAKKALATFDPIGALATSNASAFEELRKSAAFQSGAVNDMLARLAGDREVQQEIEETMLDQAVQLRPEREYVVVMCDADSGEQWDELRELLGLKLVRRGGYKKGSQFDATGIERVIPAAKLIAALKGKRGGRVDRNSVNGKAGQGEKPGVAGDGDGVRPGDGAKGLSGGGDKKRRRSSGKSPRNHGDA